MSAPASELVWWEGDPSVFLRLCVPLIDHVVLTICEVAYRQSLGRLGNVSQREIRLPFSNHQVNNDQRFEDDGPC